MWATPSIAESRTASQVHYIFHMCRPHHAGIIDGHVGKEPVEIHILLGMRIDQIMIMMPR